MPTKKKNKTKKEEIKEENKIPVEAPKENVPEVNEVAGEVDHQHIFDVNIARKMIRNENLSQEEKDRYSSMDFADEKTITYWNDIFSGLRTELGAEAVDNFLNGIEVEPPAPDRPKTLEEFNAIFVVEKDNSISEKTIDRVNDVMGFAFPSKEESQKLEEHLRNVNKNTELNNAFELAGAHSSANSRQNVTFLAYLMGEKGMTFQDAIHFLPGVEGYEAMMNEFHKFVIDHPVIDKTLQNEGVQKDPQKVHAINEKIKTNVTTWTNLYIKCADKFLDYSFPDINYADAKAVKAHAYEFNMLKRMQIDFSQEFERMSSGERKLYAQEAAGGSQSLSEKINAFNGIQPFLDAYVKAYNIPDVKAFIRMAADKKKNLFEDHANYRLDFAFNIANKYKGKKVRDIRNAQGMDDVIGIVEAYNKPTISFPKNEAKLLFLNNSFDSKKEAFETAIENNKEVVRKAYNSGSQNASLNTVQIHIDSVVKSLRALRGEEAEQKRAAWNHILEAENDPTELLQRVKSNDGAIVRKDLKSVFNEFLTGNTRPSFYKYINREPMSLIRIGGKTPEELWGDQAKNMNTADKEIYYQVMTLKEVKRGNKDVTVDRYFLDANRNFFKTAPFILSYSKANVNKRIAVFRDIAALHERLSDYKKELDTTRTSQSSVYAPFLQALKDCIEATDLKKSKADLTKMMESIKRLQETAKAYYKAHTTGVWGLFSAYKGDGKARLRISKELKNSLPYELEALKDLTGHLNDFTFDKDNLPDDVSETRRFHVSSVWDRIKRQGRICGLEDDFLEESLTGKNKYVEKIYQEAVTRTDMRKRIMATYKKNVTELEKSNDSMKGMFETEEDLMNLAKTFVKSEYLIPIRLADGPFALTTAELEKEIMDPDFENRFHSRVDEVFNDPKFRELAKDKPEECVSRYHKHLQKQNAEKHRNLYQNDPRYKKLKDANPNHFEERWDAAEKRAAIWKRELENFNAQKEATDLWMNHAAILPDPAFGVLPQFTQGRINETREKLYKEGTELLTKAILKDLCAGKKNSSPFIMDYALAPEKVDEMRTNIGEFLKKNKVFETGEAAYQLQSIGTLKRLAVIELKSLEQDKIRTKEGHEVQKQLQHNKAHINNGPKNIVNHNKVNGNENVVKPKPL